MKAWEIIAGEYPPGRGGVADYTAAVAEGLTQRGRLVRVWQRGDEASSIVDSTGVVHHRCAGHFAGRGLQRLNLELNRLPSPRRILIQYVPHAFGYKGMNTQFASWVRSRSFDCQDDVRIMFHEVAYPWVRWPLHHNLMAATNRWMVRRMIQGASQNYVSTEAWSKLLMGLGARREEIKVLPIPSNIPASNSPIQVERIRNSLSRPGSQSIVGHFGTYGKWVSQSLAPIIEGLFKHSNDFLLHLIGGNSDRFRGELIKLHPNWESRISATGRLPCDEVAHHINACDVMLQPYPDGANTRRTTLMACLINARATVTTKGANGESFWHESGCVCLADEGNAESAVRLTLGLLADKDYRRELGESGFRYYNEHFAIDRTLETLTLHSE